ncbi:MAG: SulP family inorganic anion transporter [Lachnospiraceae bacterium]
MKYFRKENLTKDILSGIIVALVSIPIAMGYAQVAGLPAVYGLYGSVLPILVYGFFTSSPQFVFGVDATPAALVGGFLASLGIVSGSPEAMQIVPVITMVTAVWLLIFYFVKAGKLVNYISTPVMGGFISGIGCTIILMLVPKLFGGDVGTGELFVLLFHIWEELKHFNLLSAALGIGTVIIMQIAKKYIPKFPMSVALMAVGAGLTAFFHVDRYGVKLLPSVEAGLPKIILPDFSVLLEHGEDIIVLSLTIALVIVAQTLLATNNFALRYNYKINNNREVLAYAAGNAAGALVGCCPINGSVSRTGIADQYGCKSQVMSIAAAITMILVLLFGTGILAYLPIPVLTGIVVSALIGIIEFKVAKKTWQSDKQEFGIFMAAFLGVLLLGTIYGVVIGVVLSFVAVIIRAVIPPKAFLGMIPGHEELYNLKRNRDAIPIEHTVIYRFSGNLFFANINAFQQDIENAIKEDTKQVIVDARGIGNIDITAAERLVILNRNLKNRGIHFYLTEHVGAVNDQLRALGAESLIEEGVVRRTVSLALRSAGVTKPYPLEGVEKGVEYPYVEANERLAEFEWAFGEGAEEKMEQLATEMAERLAHTEDYSASTIVEAENDASWGRVGLFDEDELLERLEMHLSELEDASELKTDIKEIEKRIAQRREVIEKKIKNLSPEALEMLKRHREEIEEHLRQKNPGYYEKVMKMREKDKEKKS